MTVEISIIVPVYNLENVLLRCVHSILNQTFTHFELILVNDGSTDESGKLCDELARHDARIKVIHKKNGGVASSRNAGLNIAQGKFIGYVDNDDYINKHMFATLYDIAIKNESDIVVCDYVNVKEDEHVDIDAHVESAGLHHFTNQEAVDQIYIKRDATFVYPWNKLYRRHLFTNIRYEEGNLYDDESVAHKLLYESKKTTYLQSTFYYYVTRKGSMVNSPFHVGKFGRIYALKDREVFLRKKNERYLHGKALIHYLEMFFWYYHVAETTLKDIDSELKKLKTTFNKTLIHILKQRHIGRRRKVMCVLFWLHPALFHFVKHGIERRREKRQSMRV